MLIRDPIHGDIELNPRETEILDSPELQRLRTIKQLGTAYLVFPGCTHTRFEHSLGTLAVAKRIMSVLKQGMDIEPEVETAISCGALLHDITHIPFGHTFEDERKIFQRHDKGMRLQYFMRQDSTLGRNLEKLGIRTLVESLLNGQITDWRSQLISSALDADLLDYLRRDAYMAGLAQTYDDRLFQYFTVSGGDLVLNMVKHNMDRPDVKSEIIHLLRLRYYLTERVYFHHAKVISGAMISKALEIALEYGLSEKDLLVLGDYTLFEKLKAIGSKHNPAINSLVQAVEERRLMKRAYVLSSASISPEERESLIDLYHKPGIPRHEAEKRIAAKSGLNSSEVILYCPGDRTFREAGISVLTKEGKRKLNSPLPEPPEEITYLEKQYKALWRLYVFAPPNHTEKVKNVCHEFFGKPSEH